MLGGLLTLVSWRLIFFASVPAGAAALVLLARTAGSPRHSLPFDWAGQVAAVLGMGRLTQAKGATLGQVALAWMLAQHRWIVPIPGTRPRERLAENAAATQVALSADEVADLDTTAARIGVRGNRYNDLHMGLVGR